jgi:DNA-binding MarR family transcriptional regulator
MEHFYNINIKCWVLLSCLNTNSYSITEALSILNFLGSSPSTSRKLLFELIHNGLLCIVTSNSDKRLKMLVISDDYRNLIGELLNTNFLEYLSQYKKVQNQKYQNLIN